MSGRYCLECGSPLPNLEAGGVCSICALRGALAAGVETQIHEASREADEPAADAMPLASGHKFGDYEILEEIARGGMGVVYKARQISLDRVVAIKMLLPGLSSPEYLRRFRIEASATAGLQHPHIVSIHEVGAWQGRPFLVMDYVEGPSLAQWIAKADRKPADFKESARLLKAVAEAVQYAHEHGILHRDLKPSNVLVDRLGQPRVTDFGLAKRFERESQVTLSGRVLGSPSYMPPEQAVGNRGKVSSRSDVYCLGATLYHILTGRAPFQGDNPADVLHQVLTSEPVAPRLLNPGIPRDLETICLKCIEKEPARRYASARLFADELGRFLDDRPSLARPVRAPEKIWRWCHRKPLVASLALILAVSLALACWFWWQARLSSGQLAQERMRAAINTALLAAWGGDRANAEKAIQEVDRYGLANEWVPMLRGQIALYNLQSDEAVRQFERAVALAPQSVVAKAMLVSGYLYSGRLDRYAEILHELGALSPQTPEDFVFLGAALVAGYPDTGKPVMLLEHAAKMRPSGVAYLQLAMAEGFHAADVGSWPAARKAIEHYKWAEEILGSGHPALLAVRLNTYNFAMRLCPEEERTSLRRIAAEAAENLQSTGSPIGRMQRSFYFELTGNERAEAEEWSKAVQQGGGGLYISYYAAAMLNRNRSNEALKVLNRLEPPSDALSTVAQAFLLLDKKLPDDARKLYPQAAASQGPLKALAETILLLAGDTRRVIVDSEQYLNVISPQHPVYQAMRFYAGRISAEELAAGAGTSKYQTCADAYIIAMSFLSKGDREAARHYFRRSVETGISWLPQYQWSRAFLARLERDSDWPPWIANR
jgi:tetratricopeptide (TPR) repeat protein